MLMLHFYYLDEAGQLLVHRWWSEIVSAPDIRRLARISATARRADLVEIEGDGIHEFWRRDGSAWLRHEPTFAADTVESQVAVSPASGYAKRPRSARYG